MKRIIAIFLLAALLLCGCGAPAATEAPTEPLGELKVHFIDVGHGDSMLVECNGEFMLIDAGESYAGPTVISYLQNLGVEKLDIVVSTHPHTDHMTGFTTVLQEFTLGKVYRSHRTSEEPFYLNFISILKEQNITPAVLRAGTSFTLGKATVTVVGPVQQYSNVNNDSLVLMIEFGSNRFLLTGDMEQMAENDLIASGVDLKADVLKLGHHGSNTSTSAAFLDAVQPKYGIISVGSKNAHNLPDEGPLFRMEERSITVYRTDTMGTIVATSDGTNITFTQELTP